MKGRPMHIHLKDDAVPVKITTARKVPIHWLESSHKAMEHLIPQDVLQVEEDPTDWNVHQASSCRKGPQMREKP